MSKYIAEPLRIAVAKRADFRCEYCRRPEADSFIKYQIDHIISRKHRGETVFDNLAFSCPICNNNKGTDLGTVLDDKDTLVRLFHPLKHSWFDHFEVSEEGMIYGKTTIGEATIVLLDLNHTNRVLERIDLIKSGLFP